MKNKGFTIKELLIVFVLAALIIGIPTIINYNKKMNILKDEYRDRVVYYIDKINPYAYDDGTYEAATINKSFNVLYSGSDSPYEGSITINNHEIVKYNLEFNNFNAKLDETSGDIIITIRKKYEKKVSELIEKQKQKEIEEYKSIVAEYVYKVERRAMISVLDESWGHLSNGEYSIDEFAKYNIKPKKYDLISGTITTNDKGEITNYSLEFEKFSATFGGTIKDVIITLK